MKLLLIGTILILLGAAGWGGWYFYTHAHEPAKVMGFIDAFGEYSARAHDTARVVTEPGAAHNSARQSLFANLEIILSDGTTDTDRLAAAQNALTSLTLIKKEVDAAQAQSAEVYKAIADLEKAAILLQNEGHQARAQAVVALVKERQEKVSHIASVMTVTNDETEIILNRVIADEGALKSGHALAINEATDSAEERFDRTVALSRELIQTELALDTAYRAFVEAGW